jgi:ABC-2 type transport system ATP-binding protein
MDEISIRYRIPHERIPSLKEFAIRWLRRSITYQDFWALRGMSLEINKGEVLGIIGANGSGKTTLLKVIARVLRPTTGRIRIVGRVAPLLELGTGFDVELSGRDNIFLNGTILGFSHQDIQRRLEGIVQYAGIKDFIDAPLRTYSTGMVSRLAFAIATDVKPDILIVDEVLAVGDSEFQKKSIDRIMGFSKQGATILLVSHNLNQVVSICHRAIWLAQGTLKACGPAKEVVAHYQKAIS